VTVRLSVFTSNEMRYIVKIYKSIEHGAVQLVELALHFFLNGLPRQNLLYLKALLNRYTKMCIILFYNIKSILKALNDKEMAFYL
jgi:hypothetical protein